MQNRNGSQTLLHYDPMHHSLWEQDSELKPNILFEPQKCPQKIEIRISIGRKCNFSCTYCSQHMCNADDPEGMNAENLVRELIRITRGEISVVQLWGGEPLLYFARIQELYTQFEKQMPNHLPDFHITTNGSLLWGEKIDWLLEKCFSISVSWDGHGQYLRGPEIFENTQIVAAFRRLYAAQPGRVALSPVLTNSSWDYATLLKKIETIIGPSTISLCESRCLTIVDDQSRRVAIADGTLPLFAQKMYDFLLTHPHAEQHLALFANTVTRFIRTLGTEETPHGTRCFVGKPNTLTVDMAGNILTCQNFNATAVDESGEPHCLGHITALPELHANIPRPMAVLSRLVERQQKKCQHCVVFAICKGGCPYSPAEYDDINCKCYYHQFLPVFGLALYKLTGAVLKEVRTV